MQELGIQHVGEWVSEWVIGWVTLGDLGVANKLIGNSSVSFNLTAEKALAFLPVSFLS